VETSYYLPLKSVSIGRVASGAGEGVDNRSNSGAFKHLLHQRSISGGRAWRGHGVGTRHGDNVAGASARVDNQRCLSASAAMRAIARHREMSVVNEKC